MAVLSRLRESDGTPLFVLKGGVAMHLRFPTRARLSLDQDVVFRREMRDLERVLAQASRHPIGRFRVEAIGKPEKIEKTPAYRQRIRVTYNGSDFATVHLEASPREGHSIDPDTLDRLDPSPDLSLFGFDSIDPIPAMSVPYQIAQKIHACTEIPSDGKPNKRQTDLLDLQLLEELIRPGGWPTVRRACVEVFAGRHKHAWPPRVVIWSEWPPIMLVPRLTSVSPSLTLPRRRIMCAG